MMREGALLAFLLVLGACTPPVQAATAGGEVPPERATECMSVCEKLGMRLSAMVVMMNEVGCVCEPPNAPPPAALTGGASVASGGTSIAAAQAAQAAAHAAAMAAQMRLRQQQQQQQQQQRRR